MNKLMDSDLWETPMEIFGPLNEEFHFDVDACATSENTKCQKFFSPEEDGLTKDWYELAQTVWMNPPYSKEGRKDAWIEKAFIESLKGCTVVALLPVKTDTKAFHKYIHANESVETRFLKGRIRFLRNGQKKSVGRFASMIVIFRPPTQRRANRGTDA